MHLPHDLLTCVFASLPPTEHGVVACVCATFRALLPGPYTTDPTTSLNRLLWSGVAGTRRVSILDVCRNGNVCVLQFLWTHFDTCVAPFLMAGTTRAQYFSVTSPVSDAYGEALRHEHYHLVEWFCDHVEDPRVWLNYWLQMASFSYDGFIAFTRLLTMHNLDLASLGWNLEGTSCSMAWSCVQMVDWFLDHIPQVKRLQCIVAQDIMFECLLVDGVSDVLSEVIEYLCARFTFSDISLANTYHFFDKTCYFVFCDLLLGTMNTERIYQMHKWGVPRQIDAPYLLSLLRPNMIGGMTEDRLVSVREWILATF